MTKKYCITFWEKESVWVKRTVEVSSEKVLNTDDKESIIDAIEYSDTEYIESDYAWETSDHVCYDLESLQIEEIEK